MTCSLCPAFLFTAGVGGLCLGCRSPGPTMFVTKRPERKNPKDQTMRKKVYIAGPISKGDLASNINQGTAAFVALTKAGFAPMCPHWSVYSKPVAAMSCGTVLCEATAMGNEDMTHADWMGVDLPWVECAHAVLRLPGESTGADLETAHAERHLIPVFTSTEELVAHFAAGANEVAA